MITVGSRVSGRYGKLIPNLRGANYRHVSEEIFGIVENSVEGNKYTVEFDNPRVCALYQSEAVDGV